MNFICATARFFRSAAPSVRKQERAFLPPCVKNNCQLPAADSAAGGPCLIYSFESVKNGYIDWGIDGDTLLHTGKYIKYPKNGNCQRWINVRPDAGFATANIPQERAIIIGDVLITDSQLNHCA